MQELFNIKFEFLYPLSHLNWLIKPNIYHNHNFAYEYPRNL